jgi:uncharacterized membrane protein YedE/YeeE
METAELHTIERTPKPYINPYLGGVLLGLVLLSAYFFAGEGLGASGAFKNGIAACASVFGTDETGFFDKTYLDMKANPKKMWIVIEMLGVLVGGFLSGALSHRLKLKVEHSPKITTRRRLIFAFAGGIFFGIGSQFGRGCTSGAALSGMATISVAGFLTMIFIFGTGYAFAYLVRKNWI